MDTPLYPNPFVGPRPIQTDEALHGRDVETLELFHRLQARRIVVLHSPSGAGKSSLVAAGLIPKLRGARFDVWKTIRVNLDPSTLPDVPPETNRYLLSTLVSLEEELRPEKRRSLAELAGMDLRAYLAGRTRRKGREDWTVVLIFDQFEEVLTAGPRAVEQKREFFTSLGRALDDGDTRALFIIREDYLGAFAPYRDRVPTQMAYTFRLDLLGLDAAREAAVKLAEKGGRSFPGVDHLVRELSTVTVMTDDGPVREPGLYVEPVQLQVVGHRVWERMAADDASIDAEDIGSSEDVSKALGSYYAASVERIAGKDLGRQRALREWVGTRLIVAGIRSQVRREARVTAGLDNDLIEKLKDSYLVRSDTRAGLTWYELAHDRLVAAVTQDNADWEAKHLHPMQVQARLWVEGGRKAEMLLSAGALPAARRWAKENGALVTAGEREFLAESAKARVAELLEQRRSRRVQAELARLLEEAQAARKEAEEQASVARIARNDALAQAERARVATALFCARELVASGPPHVSLLVLAAIASHAGMRGWHGLFLEVLALPFGLEGFLFGHEGPVRFVAWSPDGTRILSGSDDQGARVWRGDGTGNPVVLRGHQGLIRSGAWSPDGTRIVTASVDTTARVWRSDGAGEPVVLRGHRSAVVCAAWSPDGTWIVTASADGTARVWRSDGTGEPVVLRGHWGCVNSAAWSPDGTRIATASDTTARVWRPWGPADPVVLRGHQDAVVCASWSPDGTRIVTASSDATARVWPADGGGDPVVLQGHARRVYSAAWSPDGTRILTASGDDTARVWRSDQAGEPVVLRGEGGVRSAAWSPDGSRIVVVCFPDLCVWRSDGIGEPAVLRGHKHRIHTAAWSPDGARIVTASEDKTARVYRPVGAVEPVVLACHRCEDMFAAWSPDGTRIVTASNDGTARVWRSDGTGEPVVLRGHEKAVRSAAWSPDGTRIVTASEDGTARVWRSDGTGEPVVLRPRSGGVHSAAWSPDGTRIVIVSDDSITRVWRSDGTGEPVGLSHAWRGVRSAAWSPDGTRIVTASEDWKARVWRSDGTGEPVVVRGHDAGVNSAAWGRDGTWIVTASGDSTARVWRSGRTGMVLRGHESSVHTAALSPDETRIVTASEDKTARVWRSDGTGEPVVLRGHEGQVFSAAWSPDGTRIVTASDDNTARVWRSDGTGEPVVLRGHERAVHSASWSPDGTRILTASRDGTARIWRTTEALLSLVPPLCLSPAQRELYLVEDPPVARANYEACERSHGRTPLDNPPDI